MRKIKGLALIFFLFVLATASAQTNRYVVYFTDKANSAFSISKPEEFLSQRSISRRAKNSVPVTDEDLPVNKSYVTALQTEGASVFYTSRWFNAALVEMDMSLVPVIEVLGFVSSVDFAAPQAKLNGRKTSNHRFPNSKSRTTAGESDFQINYIGADEMHSDGFKGQGILIAVTDAGFINVDNISQFAHLYQDGRLVYTFDFTIKDPFAYAYSGHGTEVLSTLGAFDSGFTGTAPEASYMLFVTEDVSSEYRVEEYNWLLAAELADSAGVDIINGSIGYNVFDSPSMNYAYNDMDGKTTIISRAAAIAASKGMLIVTGSGNEGNKSWKYILAPGDVEAVLTVGSVNSNGNISSFSGVGPTSDGRIKPDLVTFGSSVSIINGSGNIVTGSGTSYAAPQIAGLAAGLMQAYPELTVPELVSLMKQSANQYDSPDNSFGYGIPNYSKFVALKTQKLLPNYFRVYPNPVENGSLELVSVNLLEEQALEIRFLNLNGQIFRKFNRRLNLTNNSLSLDINFLPQGTYIMHVKTAGKSESFRIIKTQ